MTKSITSLSDWWKWLVRLINQSEVKQTSFTTRSRAVYSSLSCIACIYCVISLQVRNYKLVSNGIIRPEIFYKALTVWIDRDVLGYAFSQVCLKKKIDNNVLGLCKKDLRFTSMLNIFWRKKICWRNNKVIGNNVLSFSFFAGRH